MNSELIGKETNVPWPLFLSKLTMYQGTRSFCMKVLLTFFTSCLCFICSTNTKIQSPVFMLRHFYSFLQLGSF